MKSGIAVIGGGYWGKKLIRVFSQLHALSAACDTDASVASTLPSGTVFSSCVEDVWSNRSISAVAIATPSRSHYELAKQALLANKDVFVEKPLCLNVDHGLELVRIAEDRGRILMVGHLLHFHPAIAEMKRLLRSGDLGDLRFIQAERMNFGKFRQDENVLWSFAPHDVSLALDLVGEMPTRVFSSGYRALSSHVTDATSSEFTFPSGVGMHMFVGWVSPVKVQRFVAVGSKKIAVFDGLNGGTLSVCSYGPTAQNDAMHEACTCENVVVSDIEPLRAECEHFIACITERRTPLTDGREGVRVLTVLDACQRSMEGRQPIPFPIES